jgi:hypothetical protein
MGDGHLVQSFAVALEKSLPLAAVLFHQLCKISFAQFSLLNRSQW